MDVAHCSEKPRTRKFVAYIRPPANQHLPAIEYWKAENEALPVSMQRPGFHLVSIRIERVRPSSSNLLDVL